MLPARTSRSWPRRTRKRPRRRRAATWAGSPRTSSISTQEAAIFAAPIGKASDIVTADNGLYIYYVREEQTRKPDGAQLDTLKANAFQNWYAAEKLQADITPDLTAPSS